jgi:hypothetical protein
VQTPARGALIFSFPFAGKSLFFLPLMDAKVAQW